MNELVKSMHRASWSGDMTGLSLSFCVQDILEDKIDIDKVKAIICGFDWTGTAPEMYYEVYWSKFVRSDIEAVLAQLTIVKRGPVSVYIAEGHWMTGIASPDRLKNVHDRIRF